MSKSNPMSWAVTFSVRRTPTSTVGSASKSSGVLRKIFSSKVSCSRHTSSNAVSSTLRSRPTPSLNSSTPSSTAADQVTSMAVPTCALIVMVGTWDGPPPGRRLFDALWYLTLMFVCANLLAKLHRTFVHSNLMSATASRAEGPGPLRKRRGGPFRTPRPQR